MEAMALGAGEEPGMGARLLRALRHRNYRLYFMGQGVSLIGTWLTSVATSWLVYRLTGSTVLLGVVAFAGQIPLFVLAPFMGVLVDRWNRHRILIVTQIVAMLQSFALAYLALRRIITVHHVIVLNAIQGVVNSLDMPARQALVPTLVPLLHHFKQGRQAGESFGDFCQRLGVERLRELLPEGEEAVAH